MGSNTVLVILLKYPDISELPSMEKGMFFSSMGRSCEVCHKTGEQ